MDAIKDVLSVMGSIIAVVFVVVAAYYATRWLGKRMALPSNSGGRYLNVVDKLALGKEKSVAIIKVGAKYILVGIAHDNISTLCELNEQDLVATDPTTSELPSFKEAFMDSLKNLKSSYVKKGGTGSEEDK